VRKGEDHAGEQTVMVYSFRLCLTKDPANRVPFPRPKAYDPARFELVRRYFQKYPNAPLPWDLYPLPGNKFDANNGIGKMFSMGLVGEANGWCASDPAGRAQLWDKHKEYTLEFYHFLTTDAAVPAKIRETMAELGLCRDEFPETGHWSPQLYVREGRRLDGRYTLTQRDIIEDPSKDDPIAVSSFPIDSHDCRRIALPEGVLNEGTIFPVRMPGRPHGYAYHIPYRAITPAVAECSNLLVPVALSATHVAYASVRVEPTWMAIGQSAGIAAALSAKEGVTVQVLDYGRLRARLLAQNQVLDLPVLPPLPAKSDETGKGAGIAPASLPGLILDDAQAELSGDWERSTNFKPHVGSGYLHDGRRSDRKSQATFRFQGAGRRRVRTPHGLLRPRDQDKPTAAQARGGGSEHRFTVDQTQPLPAGEAFRPLGHFMPRRGIDYVLTVSNDDTTGFVILDAFQLLPVGASAKSSPMKTRLLLCLPLSSSACSTPETERPAATLLPAGWDAKAAGDKVMAGLIKVSGPAVKGAHDSHLVIVGERAYVVAEANDRQGGEAADLALRLRPPFRSSTSATERLLDVMTIARSEQAFANETLPVRRRASSRASVRSVRRALAACRFASEAARQTPRSQTYYRDLDLGTMTFEPEIHRMKIRTADGVFDLQPQHLHADAAKQGFLRKPSDAGLYLFDNFKDFDGRTFIAINNYLGAQQALCTLNATADTLEIVGHFNGPGGPSLTEPGGQPPA
jgi:hypothetical protein